MGMYLEKEEVVAQFQKTQSQNQQNLSMKNPKHQAGIEAALSYAQKGARLERSRYNQVPTRSCHPHTQRLPKVVTESNTPMKTEAAKGDHDRLKKPQESM
jgi:hypothetical protein